MVLLVVHFSNFLLSSRPKSTSISMLHIEKRLFLGNHLSIMYLYNTSYPSTIHLKASIKTNTTAQRENRNTVLYCKTGRKFTKTPLRAVREKY